MTAGVTSSEVFADPCNSGSLLFERRKKNRNLENPAFRISDSAKEPKLTFLLLRCEKSLPPSLSSHVVICQSEARERKWSLRPFALLYYYIPTTTNIHDKNGRGEKKDANLHPSSVAKKKLSLARTLLYPV